MRSLTRLKHQVQAGLKWRWLQSLSHSTTAESTPVISKLSFEAGGHGKSSHDMTKELILSILATNATKRDARWYLTRYAQQQKSKLEEISKEGPIYASLFNIDATCNNLIDIAQNVSGEIASLHRLGMGGIILLSLQDTDDLHQYRLLMRKLGDALEARGCRTMTLHGAAFSQLSDKLQMDLSVDHLPLRKQIIIMSPFAFSSQGTLMPVSTKDALMCLARSVPSDHIRIEKLIMLNPAGGLPSIKRGGRSHVFVNLKQELDDVRSSLSQASHLDALDIIHAVLSTLPATSSAILLSPLELSQRHPLVHNLLTDKPLFSPSLPHNSARTMGATNTTVFRIGMPVRIIKCISLENNVKDLDVDRLELLINDSFGRRLNREHYLNRCRGSVAAVIIAGDYEGAAVITWERISSGHHVPYLDKFAVAKRTQGSAGIADVLFNSMTDLFPHELVWRSRSTNPVNKWVRIDIVAKLAFN